MSKFLEQENSVDTVLEFIDFCGGNEHLITTGDIEDLIKRIIKLEKDR